MQEEEEATDGQEVNDGNVWRIYAQQEAQSM